MCVISYLWGRLSICGGLAIRLPAARITPAGGLPIRRRLVTCPATALPKRQDLVRFHAAVELLQTGRPVKLDIGRGGGPEAEVQPEVALRVKTGLAQDLLPLAASSGRHEGPRADGAPIRFGANQFQRKPAIAVAGLIAEQ